MTNQPADQPLVPVTVLGLGDMGRALAHALLHAGHPTTVWNRSPAKADRLVAEGATRADTPEAAVAASPLVIVCLLDHASVHEVLDPVAGTLSGRVLVNLTTGSPGDARELSTWAGTHGVAGFLDGGIMAVPSMIGVAGTVILYSGDQVSYDGYESTLAGLGAARYVGSDPGQAALLDLALLHGMYGMFAGFLQAAAIVGTQHVPAVEFTTSLLAPLLLGMVDQLPEYARQVDASDYKATESNLAMQATAMNFAEFNASIGISGELFAPLERLMKQRVADGHGDEELTSIIELIKHPHRPL